MKALLCSGLVPFELDPIAIDRYFHYLYVPEPATPIKGVCKLDAAHVMTVNVNPWQIEETCYWRMEDAPPLEGDPAELIRAELETISELAIRSDVPVGVALSGGLDSSAIAALAVCKYPDTMHAFSVGYPGHPPNDERADAKALADHLGMPFHDVELTTADMVAFFPDLVYWRDDPIADISGYGYYAVMKLASERGVPVVLQGQGGDELFWGYASVRQAVRESLQKSALLFEDGRAYSRYLALMLPDRWSCGTVWDWLRSLVDFRSKWQQFQRHKMGPAERLVFYDLEQEFQAALNHLKNMYAPGFRESLNGASSFDLFTFPQPWEQIDILLTRLICQTYLVENGIAQGDRLSMASSVELRLPLVDYRFVETVIGLRKSRSDFRLPPKAWLKAAMKGILPDWVMNRPKKGFAPPVRVWLQALFAAHGSMLDDGYLVQAGVIRPESARSLVDGSSLLSFTESLAFRTLVLEIWCRRFASLG